jgi:hypothetical protein
VKLSVALCTYNGARYLPAQLASIASQTRLPDELVARDDGSADATPAILEEFGSRAPFRVQLDLGGPRLGSTGNFERTISQCTGDVIALSDQDDVWLPGKLCALNRSFEDDPRVVLAFSDARLLSSKGQVISPSTWDALGFQTRARHRFAADPLRALLGRAIVAGCMLAFRADVRDALLPFPAELDAHEPMYHDRWISLVSAAIGRVVAIDEPLVEYRVHEEQQVGIRLLRVRRLTHPRLWRLAALTVSPRERDLRHGARVAQLAALTRRLQTTAQPSATSLGDIQACSRHLEARIKLPRAPWSRAAVVAAEWRSGGYRDWSLGASSAVIDLLR